MIDGQPQEAGVPEKGFQRRCLTLSWRHEGETGAIQVRSGGADLVERKGCAEDSVKHLKSISR